MTAINQEVTTFPSGGGGSWDLPTVAFVNPSGNNGTAVVGDGNLPYQTVAAAQAVSAIIFLQPGTYTETIALVTGKTYFSYPGVVFTTGGVENTGSTLVGTKWLGYSRFIGTQQQIRLDNVTLTEVELEYDTMEITGGSNLCLYIDCDNTSTLQIRCNSMYDPFTANGSAVVIKGPITGSLDVKEHVTGLYGVLTLGFSGEELDDFTVTCPRMVCEGVANAGFSSTINCGGVNADKTLTINGDVHNDSTGAVTGDTGGIFTRFTGGGNLVLNGNIYAGVQRGVNMDGTTNVIVNGNISTSGSAFVIIGAANLLLKGSTIVQAIANSITGASSNVWIYDTSFNSTSNANIIEFITATGQLILNDVTAFGVSFSPGNLVNTGGNAYAVGMINVTSNYTNDVAMTSLFGSLGYVEDSAILTPEFI